MKRKYFKGIVAAAVIWALVVGLSGCAGIGDWQSEPISGGYIVFRANNESISLVLPVDDAEGIYDTIIDGVVKEVAYNDEFVLVKRVGTKTKNEYFIIEVGTGEVTGPMKKASFEKTCIRKNIPKLEWINVRNLKMKTE